MKIPSKVRIGSATYNVNLRPGPVVIESKVCYGTVDYNSLTIEIDTKHAEDIQKCTFFHEITHAIANERGVEIDEKAVTEFAKGLYQFYVDNVSAMEE